MNATPSARRHDLDWIRVGAFFLLILYHVGMFYVPWDWHVKSPHVVAALEPVMMLTNPWRLPLLFLVSGAATRFMADRMSAPALARLRAARLLPPLLLAIFVIVPPQTYYQLVELGYTGGWGEFYRRYATASGHWCDASGCLITPTYNHMWFVAYLFVYTMVLALMLAFARPALAGLERVLERLTGWRLLALPILALALARFALAPFFPVTHAFVDDWYTHAVSFSLFLVGFSIAKSESLKKTFISLRWPALALAVAAYAVYVLTSYAFAIDQWCAIVAVLGFGAKHLNRGGPALRYLTLAVFPFYIIHQTIIVVAAHHLAKVGLNQGLEAAILIFVTFAGCFATYEAARRVNWLRPWFGLKPQEATARRPPAFA